VADWLASRLHDGRHVVGPLDEFLSWWYGPPQRDLSPRRAPDIPAPLSAWYAAEESWARKLCSQNYILSGTELRRDGDYTVFWVENQNVWLWAYAGGDDPAVFDRENQPNIPWAATGAKLSDFLVQAAMFEAIMGSLTGASAVDISRSEFNQIVAPLAPVAMTPWTWPGPDHRLYIGQDLLAFGGVNPAAGRPAPGEPLLEIVVAARSDDDLAYVDHVAVDWAHNSRLFGR
jgi:hypothetical protein